MHTLITGVVIGLIGLWIWLSNMGYANFSFSRDWPVLLIFMSLYVIGSGVSRLVRRRSWRLRVLKDLERGKISVEEAAERLRKGR